MESINVISEVIHDCGMGWKLSRDGLVDESAKVCSSTDTEELRIYSCMVTTQRRKIELDTKKIDGKVNVRTNELAI